MKSSKTSGLRIISGEGSGLECSATVWTPLPKQRTNRTGPVGPDTQAWCFWVMEAARGPGGSWTWDCRAGPSGPGSHLAGAGPVSQCGMADRLRDTAPEVTREKFYRQVRESSQFGHIAPGLCLSPLKCPFWVPCCCSPPVLLCVRCLLIFRWPLQGALSHVQCRLQHCPPVRKLGSRQEFILFRECLPCAGPCPGD